MVDLTAAHLRSFLAVAEELHFGRAAEKLHVSPSSISEHVATLEHRMGKTLFARTSRSVTLTQDGIRLLPLAQRAVSAMDEVVKWATSMSSEPRSASGCRFSAHSSAPSMPPHSRSFLKSTGI